MFVTINYARKTGKVVHLKKFNEMMKSIEDHFHTLGPNGEVCHNGKCKVNERKR